MYFNILSIAEDLEVGKIYSGKVVKIIQSYVSIVMKDVYGVVKNNLM